MALVFSWYSEIFLLISGYQKAQKGLDESGMDGLYSYEYFCMSVPYPKGVLYLLANQNLAVTNV